MIALASVIERYRARFEAGYGAGLGAEQRRAVAAVRTCRSGHHGEVEWHCQPCNQTLRSARSCGHRSCPRCQHHQSSRWLERQAAKLLPVEYFMVTFTLPRQLRALARHHPREVYGALLQCAHATVQTFAANDRRLGAKLGCSAVLHTHSRRLAFHPHVHLVVPAGCLNRKRRQWRKSRGTYLFNEVALAKVFRARLLEALRRAGLTVPHVLPERWVADCRHVGHGLPALQYLSRYLYRGVISERDIVGDDGTHVTFRFRPGGCDEYQTLRVRGEQFLHLVFQHVLPKGFRRVRDYGFLHGNATRTLRLIQLILQVLPGPPKPTVRPAMKCPRCRAPMTAVGYIRPAWRSG